jgi:hypothetical protein
LSRQLADERGNVRLGGQLDQELLNLTLGFVSGSGENHLAVFLRKVRSELSNSRQVKTSIPQHFQKHRVPPRCASGGDSLVRLMLREVEHFQAINEHRRASPTRIKATMIDFRDMRHQIGFHPSRLREKKRETSKQLVIGK